MLRGHHIELDFIAKGVSRKVAVLGSPHDDNVWVALSSWELLVWKKSSVVNFSVASVCCLGDLFLNYFS